MAMFKLLAFYVAYFVAFSGAAVVVRDPSDIVCNCKNTSGNKYNEVQVTSALQQGQRLVQPVGGYPHIFENVEHLHWPQPCTPPFKEFPIFPNSGAYTGVGSPGTDRVVWGSDLQLCGCMSHKEPNGP
ncbi:hypothetical protein ONZ45_g14125 [Pleurotus djamor]|nr:hypothetical protein ONZ45_g14125 [Pleurotus djamor]